MKSKYVMCVAGGGGGTGFHLNAGHSIGMNS